MHMLLSMHFQTLTWIQPGMGTFHRLALKIAISRSFARSDERCIPSKLPLIK